jgi:hypothetical protein
MCLQSDLFLVHESNDDRNLVFIKVCLQIALPEVLRHCTPS